MKLLHIDSGILGEHSVTRRLSKALVAQWRNQDPGIEVAYRDLVSQPIDHLTGAHLAVPGADPATVDPALAADVANGNAALDEFLDADDTTASPNANDWCATWGRTMPCPSGAGWPPSPRGAPSPLPPPGLLRAHESGL